MSTLTYATLDLDAYACEGKLTLNSVLLWTSAFVCTDLSQLNDDADLRGASVIIPGTNGVLPKPRRRTATRKDIPMLFAGGLTRLGAVNANPAQGLIDSFVYVRSNIGIGSQSGDGTVTASWQQPGGATLTESVTVLGLRRGPMLAGYLCRAVLSIEVPAGIIT